MITAYKPVLHGYQRSMPRTFDAIGGKEAVNDETVEAGTRRGYRDEEDDLTVKSPCRTGPLD